MPVTTSASGFEDGFGRRVLAFQHEDGAVLERLYLRPQFSIYERALRDTFARLAAHADDRIVAPHAIERDPASGALVATSPFVCGERLNDLLDAAGERARDDEAVPGIDVALGFLMETLPALEALRAATGLSHGVIAPSRCVISPDGSVRLTECGFAAVLQRLNFGRERLWREFGVAVPPVAGAARFDETADVSQAALLAVMFVVGRPMTARDAVDLLPEWLAEAIEIAQIRGSVTFAVNLQRFLQRALPLPGRRPYTTVEAALQDVRQLAAAIGLDLCRAALTGFVRHATGEAAPAAADAWADGAAPAVRVSPAVDAPAPMPAFDPAEFAIDPEPELSPEPLVAEAPEPDPIEVEAFAHDPEPVAVETFVPEPEPEPVSEIETASPEPIVAHETPAPEPASAPEPVPSRRRWRLKRPLRDSLRSAVARPAPPKPEPPPPAPVVVDAPVVAPAPAVPVVVPQPVIPVMAPAPVPVAPPAVAPLPLVAQPAVEPIVLQPLAARPVVPQPVFAPVPAPNETFWKPPIEVTPAAPIALKPQPVTLAPAPPAPLKLKATQPPRPPRYEPPPEHFASYAETRRAAARPERRRPPVKFVAAAAVLIGTIFIAGRAYLPDAPSVTASVPRTEPVTVAAPPPVKTGTLVVQTQPSGARVLLDGSPAGETPLRIVDVAPGRHVLTFVTPTATLRRTVKVEANKTLTVDVPVFSGWVAIFAPIVLEVSEEGRALGSTDQGRLLLPPGRHTLTLTNRDFGYSADHTVEIEAGEVRSLNVQPAGTVNLNAVPWAEVWIDGKKVGETPVANLRLPLGNREIIFRHPELGERKVMTRITAGEPIAVTVDFSG